MLDLLRTFAVVVETGSFSAAGLRLNLNASSLARQLDRLETELGQKLLQRSTRQLKLTPAGQAFLPHAQHMLETWEQARTNFGAGDDIRGQVSLTAFDAFGREHLLPLLPGFLARFPDAQVALSLDNRVVDLHQEPFDLAIRIGPPGDSTLKCRKLATNRTVLVAAPAYLDQRGRPSQPDDLKQHNCLTLCRPRQQVWWHFERQQQQRKLTVHGNFSAVGGDPLKAMALQGLGITLVADWLVLAELHRGELERVLPDWHVSFNEAGSGDINLLWSPEATQRPIVRAFIDHLVTGLEARCPERRCRLATDSQSLTANRFP